MAVIVQHIRTGQKLILLGTGYGAFRATRPSLFFGNWAPTKEEGSIEVAAVCTPEGRIGWADSKELTVLEVDGKTPAELLPG